MLADPATPRHARRLGSAPGGLCYKRPMADPPHAPQVPRATLRLQFHAGFTLDDATRHVPYFAALGVSHIYASPLLTARPGSTHGYDIVDHNSINPELGGRPAFERFVARLHAHGLGLILDFVPNHMGVGGSDNAWWLDVLEWGRASPYARYFDIDWDPPERSLRDKLLVPFLGTPYDEALHGGELSLRFDAAEGSFSVWYFDHRVPIAPRDYAPILRDAAHESPDDQAALETLAARFAAFDARGRSRERVEGMRAAAAAAKGELAALAGTSRTARAALDAATARRNGTKDVPASFTALHRLLERQAARLAYWRVATDEVNYRRFFDINGLAGLRMEDPELFEESHRLIFALIAEGKLDGIRLDHVDGLLDPAEYCRRLQNRIAPLVADRPPPPPGAPRLATPFYVVIEKILAPHERLREDWPVNGTTGYDFMAQVAGLFADPTGEAPLRTLFARFTGDRRDWDQFAVEARGQIARNNLSSELGVLAGMMRRLAKANLATRDFTLNGLRLALIDVAAHFPVYRTYVGPNGADDEDRRDLDWAIVRARRAPGLLDRSIYDFVHDVLAVDPARLRGVGRRRRELYAIARKFQQFTGPMAAKSEEDTAFYRYFPLLALNEVGSSPARFGTTPAAFHRACQERLRHHPHAMLATATHDHKRGEDARARIAVISERPADWTRAVGRWAQLNRSKRGEIGGRPAPSRADEYLLYQTLIGAWPLALDWHDADGLAAFAARIREYMIKAVREAKRETSWALPDSDYESAVTGFVDRILDAQVSHGFLGEIASFVDGIVVAGALNGLVQTTLRLTTPGVPDLYQGTEGWDFSLVDPDNRRPVPFDRLARELGESREAPLPALLGAWRDGRVKQALIARLNALRGARPALFADGDYQPVEAEGPAAGRVLAFRRTHGEELLLVVVPVLAARLLGDAPTPLVPEAAWGDTTLILPADAGPWREAMGGHTWECGGDGRLALAPLLRDFAVAVLTQG